MKKYKKITKDGKQVSAKTIRRLKHIACKNPSLGAGTYFGTTPSGNVHIWELYPNGFSPKNKSTRFSITLNAQFNGTQTQN